MYKQDPRQTAVREQSPLRRVTVAYRNASKQTRRALLISLVALIGLVSIASAYSYTVQNGDTLYSIARHNNTTVDQLVADNGIADPNLIYVGEVLEVPGSAGSAYHAPAPSYSATANTATTGVYIVRPGDTLYKIAVWYGVTLEELAVANHLTNVHHIAVGQVLTIPGYGHANTTAPEPVTYETIDATSNVTGVPYTPAITEADPDVSGSLSCTRFNFMQGRSAYTGARAGTYVLVDANGGPIASWIATGGETDSGWINDLPIAFDSIHTKVVFYPADSNLQPFLMEIVNFAPGTSYGWMSRGQCHATEIQFPANK